MKKMIAFLLCMVTCLVLFSGCNTEHEHTTSEWKYSETMHWRVPVCSRNECALSDVVYDYGEHENKDADMFCDICGYQVPIDKENCEHVWDAGVEVEGGNGGYVMEYTCSICGSKHRETIMITPPENHFLRNQAGCEWLNEISAEDIIEIKTISGAVGVAPGSPNFISSSTDEAVIARIFEAYYWLDTTPISQGEGQIYGGGGVTIKFFLKDKTIKVLYINNGNYRDTNGDYYELLYTPGFNGDDNVTKAYGYITYIGTGTVYDKENNPVCEIPMDELEFVEADGGVDAVVTGYYYTLETEFGTLCFDYSNDLYYMQFGYDNDEYRKYYRLVGKNLDELIAEYSVN